MQDTIFREYDIRGKVNGEFKLEKSYDLAKAIAYYFVQENPKVKTVVVGMDGRHTSLEIKKQVCDALQDSGLNVVFVGMCPSPALYFALYNLPVDAGLMITASHNPKEYNGLKICLGTASVWGVQVKEILSIFKEGKTLTPAQKGSYKEHLIVTPYVDWLVENFQHLVGMDMSAVIDCGNGAGGTVMPLLLEKMQWKNVNLLYPEVDGDYPNHEADPVVEKNMQDVKHILQTTDAQVGLGLDGDCDRMAPMTKSGYLISGDQLLALFAQQVVKDNPGAAVVFDIKSSAGLIELLEKWGAQPHMSPSGHAIVKDEMRKYNALLGGELSCHFFFKDRYFGYDDGIYATLRLFEMLITTGKTLDELLTVYPKKISSTEIRIVCGDDKKHEIMQQVKADFLADTSFESITIDGVRASNSDGWGIVRVSNTQPVLSMRFESDSHDGLLNIKKAFIEKLSPYVNSELLHEKLLG